MYFTIYLSDKRHTPNAMGQYVKAHYGLRAAPKSLLQKYCLLLSESI
jgi:hypothetical protein